MYQYNGKMNCMKIKTKGNLLYILNEDICGITNLSSLSRTIIRS